MNKIKALLFAFVCMVTPALAQSDSAAVAPMVNPEDVAFSHFFVYLEGGEIYPFGDLIDAVNNSFYGGVGVRYSYWENADGFASFVYSYFTPVGKTKIDGVHQFSGKVGMDWKPKFLRPLVVGGGFACNFTRADIQDGVDISFDQDLGGTLADNETEFGWFVRVNLPLWNFEKFRVGFNVQWEELWTLPKRSDMLTMGFYVERKIW